LENIVANHKSAVKRHRQSLERAARNRTARTRVKNAVKAVRAAVQNKDKAGAVNLMSAAASVLAKAAGRKAIHRRKAARKLSRLAKAVNAIAA
jgi:small subunit ribosomal protein S20